MAAPRKDPCGTRFRRQIPEPDAHAIPEGGELGLTPLGHALLDALREDERFRDIIADPFGDHGPTGA
jgi:hypothetical protein